MLDEDAWSKLIDGLRRFTVARDLQWDPAGARSGDGAARFGIERLTSDMLNRPKVFKATGKSATYELASGDGFGRAPYELTVWEFRGLKPHPIGSIKSSTSVGSSGQWALNQKLEELFRAVDASSESSDDIVDRLLGEIGDK